MGREAGGWARRNRPIMTSPLGLGPDRHHKTSRNRLIQENHTTNCQMLQLLAGQPAGAGAHLGSKLHSKGAQVIGTLHGLFQ